VANLGIATARPCRSCFSDSVGLLRGAGERSQPWHCRRSAADAPRPKGFVRGGTVVSVTALPGHPEPGRLLDVVAAALVLAGAPLSSYFPPRWVRFRQEACIMVRRQRAWPRTRCPEPLGGSEVVGLLRVGRRRSIAFESLARLLYPTIRRNCCSAWSIPAAVHRLRMSPSRQRLTLRWVGRTISIIDSMGLVEESVLARLPVIARRVSVSVSDHQQSTLLGSTPTRPKAPIPRKHGRSGLTAPKTSG